MEYELYGCCGSVASQQNIATFVLWTFWTLWPRAGLSSEALFALKRRWECVRKGLVGVIRRIEWIEVRIQFLWLSSIPQRGVSVSLCAFDCRCTFSFFISVYLWFICFRRQKGQSGYCLICMPLANTLWSVFNVYTFFFCKSVGITLRYSVSIMFFFQPLECSFF